MKLPIASKILKSGFVERGLARPFSDVIVEDFPHAICGSVPQTALDRATKHLFQAESVRKLKKHFKFYSPHKPSFKNLKRKAEIVKDISKDILLKRQEYIAIPAALYAANSAIEYMKKPVIHPKANLQKIMDSGLNEIQNYTHKFTKSPVLSSLALGGAIYGGAHLYNKIKSLKCNQQESAHATI